jgi:hypothetical protein
MRGPTVGFENEARRPTGRFGASPRRTSNDVNEKEIG